MRLLLLPLLLCLVSLPIVGCSSNEDTLAFLQVLESISIDGVTYTEDFPTIDLSGGRSIPLAVTLRNGVTDAAIFWTVTSGTLSMPLNDTTSWLPPATAMGATIRVRVSGERAGDRGEQIFTATINLF